MEKAIDLTIGKVMDKHLSGMSRPYQFFVARVYLRAFHLVVSSAFPNLIRGLYYGMFGTKYMRIQEFLKGSQKWGLSVQRMSQMELVTINEIKVPDRGHLVFSNHVNEMDFPFDCIIINKPYLANQIIKKTLVAYWWMRAMGSEVFDNRSVMSVSISVKNLLKGIKDNSYIVYPEGRNTYSEEIQPLKKGMVKLAFDYKIPVVLILKSGIATYQDYQKGNKVAYKSFGIINPALFDSWEFFKNHLHERMLYGKEELDRERANHFQLN